MTGPSEVGAWSDGDDTWNDENKVWDDGGERWIDGDLESGADEPATPGNDASDGDSR